MLANTFCHLPRVSLNKERALWDQGIATWEDYREIAPDPTWIDASKEHLERRNPGFFADGMKPDQHWRLFGDFRDGVAFVDIETTGLSMDQGEITTIALYDGDAVKTYVNGRNLEQFVDDIREYKLLVTFNGKCFDVPFIERFFDTKLSQAHIDLRYVLRRLGYTGGLKQIERLVGIDRGELREVDGFFAVTLWHEYKRRGSETALETLLAYNCADVINLENLMVMAYNENVRATPFGGARQIPQPAPRKIPFRADPQLISRIAW